MTFNAIVEIGNSFFSMLGFDVGGRVFVTAIAGVGGVGRLVARHTVDVAVAFMIEREGVVEQLGGRPRICGVATGAVEAKLPRVDGWLGVATDAVGEACMVEIDLLPVGCVVAGGTLPRIMVDGRDGGVATQAIGEAVVGEKDFFPVCCVVAGGTLAGIMVFGSGIGVTTLAIGEAIVGEGDFVPRCCHMTQATIARVMGGWRIIDMATCAFGDVCMIEGVGFPVGNVVAIIAHAIKMVDGLFVALATNGGGVGKDAIAVTRFAVDGVTAIKGKETVINVL